MKKILVKIIEFFITKHYFLDRKTHFISKELKQEIFNLKHYDTSNFFGAKKEWYNNLNELIENLKKIRSRLSLN